MPIGEGYVEPQKRRSASQDAVDAEFDKTRQSREMHAAFEVANVKNQKEFEGFQQTDVKRGKFQKPGPAWTHELSEGNFNDPVGGGY